ncbi:MAG: hypothetical protein K2X47_00995 [Bdellovibrionales bacterium]|nr:hypothetical protein [Bdellovibrionales bacterium]
MLSRLFLVALLFLLVPQVFGAPFKSTSKEHKVFFLNPFLGSHLEKRDVVRDWAWKRVDNNGDADLDVPPETGRGVLAPISYSDSKVVFLKGTGLNSEHAGENNRIRYNTGSENGSGNSQVFFDGVFRSLQGLFDIYNSAFLDALGLKIPRPLGIISSSPGTGIYAREFTVQLRLSNLEVMSDSDARRALDHAIKTINPKLNLVTYFFWLADTLARQAATMQAVGFEHGVLHSQQVTLAGEIGDTSTGRWLDDPQISNWGKDPKQAYFRFPFQPLLIQNMLVRTHSVTPNPPVSLNETSQTKQKNLKSLLGIIQRLDPQAALKIQDLNPARYFWQRFEFFYHTFDIEHFRATFKPRDFFVTSAEEYLSHVDESYRQKFSGEIRQVVKALQSELQFLKLPRHLIFDHVKTLIQSRGHSLEGVASELLGDAPRTLPRLTRINRSFDGFRSPNYFLDEDSRQKYLLAPHGLLENQETPVIVHQKIQRLQTLSSDLPTGWEESHELPEVAWKLNIEKDSVTTSTFADFQKKVLKIRERHGSLDHPQAINEIIFAIGLGARLEYGNAKAAGPYAQLACRRWDLGEPIALSEIITLGKGECTDTTLLAFIFGKIVQELDEAYRIRVLKVGMGSEGRLRSHYLIAITAPNNRMYVIDPLFKTFGLYEDYLHPEFANYDPMFRNLIRVVQMSPPKAQCSEIVAQPISQRFGL